MNVENPYFDALIKQSCSTKGIERRAEALTALFSVTPQDPVQEAKLAHRVIHIINDETESPEVTAIAAGLAARFTGDSRFAPWAGPALERYKERITRPDQSWSKTLAGIKN